MNALSFQFTNLILQIVSRSAQYGISEVETTVATIDLEDIRSYRNAIRSRNIQAAKSPAYPRVEVNKPF